LSRQAKAYSVSYGVGDGDPVLAGDSAADGDSSVFAAVVLAACFLCGVGVGEAAVAAVVDVAVVPCFPAQETTNAMATNAVIKDKTVFFIVVVKIRSRRMPSRAKERKH
jgi:hypothetical protein